MQRRGKTFIISGPSGVGKSTVLKALFDQRTDLYFSISATTRAPRDGEVDGVHYHFIPAEEFRRMVEEDEFLEYAEYVGNFYGTPKKYVDRCHGRTGGTSFWTSRSRAPTRSAPSGRRRCVSSSRPPHGWSWSAALPPVAPTRQRGHPEAACCEPRWSCRPPADYDYLVINDTVEQAVAEMVAILCAEHCRPAERLEQLLHK